MTPSGKFLFYLWSFSAATAPQGSQECQRQGGPLPEDHPPVRLQVNQTIHQKMGISVFDKPFRGALTSIQKA